MLLRSLLTVVFHLTVISQLTHAQAETYDRSRDVIYGRSWGMSLTMDVFVPKLNRNGLGVIWVVSGGWYSAPEAITPLNVNLFVKPILDRGYTVFAVCHGSAPRFTIPEAIGDLNRAVRFIRHNAPRYQIDPDRIGIYGGSAGGHLSLTQGVNPSPPNEKTPDPVDRVPSDVQAVAAFYPPTDFLNYGADGKSAIGAGGILKDFQASFDFRTFDVPTRKFLSVTDEAQVRAIATQISPIYHVDFNDPPTLLIHGDADVLVPYEQAKRIMQKFEEAKVESKLITKPGANHGWAGMEKDTATIGEWFDQHLAKKTPATTQAAPQ
ncbi:MAG TPA: alpha/beta hydrolase [Tepidisphaeraceae bacterium]|nr:alpha/beta hydrolase [Tepidisphaeraceae bacterium]